MPSNNPLYQKEYHKKWYIKNREKRIIQIHKKNVEYKKKFLQLKEKPCTDCKNIYPYYVMEFDHLGNKIADINRLLARKAWKQLREELKKCQLVCSNCHKVRTYNRTLLAQ